MREAGNRQRICSAEALSRENFSAFEGLREVGLPDGSMERNPPAKAGDAGLIPDPGIFHLPSNN